MKKLLTTVFLFTLLLTTITGCGSKKPANAAEKKEIVYAKGSGPYTILFEDAILPLLADKGYTFKCTEITLSEADAAMQSGDVDLSVEQHIAYMEAFNHNSGANLTALSKIPTVPASVFSKKHSSLDEIADGMVIAIPQDEGNQARAFVMLQDLGLITLKDTTNYATASAEDVESNPYNLIFYELSTSYIATSLEDFDYGVITGSIVYNAGIDPSTALFNENLSENFWLQVVVRAEDANSQWAKDIVAAYQSDEFLTWLKENNSSKYNDLWSIPEY